MRHFSALALSLLLAGAGWAPAMGADAAPYEWRLPPGFPTPRVPADNPMSAAKVELGRHLFYDQRLSGNGTHSRFVLDGCVVDGGAGLVGHRQLTLLVRPDPSLRGPRRDRPRGGRPMG